MKDTTIVILGVVSAVIAAVALDWFHRTFTGPTRTVSDNAWNQSIGVQRALLNLNQAPESPAFSYQGGAPVTNYRPYQRVGVLEVPVE